jgi:regulator of sigma D
MTTTVVTEQQHQERRRGDVVKSLVVERTEMLVTYCRLAGVEPFNPPTKSVHELLQEFCQVLVDYIAAGHFTLYDRLGGKNERRKELREIAERVYPRIAESTDAALTFNDKYSEGNGSLLELSRDLSKLGEEIAVRIDLEDKLIGVITSR